MHPPPLDPSVADLAPTEPVLTLYDEKHLITYLRMLDADAANADWHDVARLVLHIDPILEPIALAAHSTVILRAQSG